MLVSLIFATTSVLCLVAGILHFMWPPWLREWEGRWAFAGPDDAEHLRGNTMKALFVCGFMAGVIAFTH